MASGRCRKVHRREAIKEMATGEANSYRLRRPDKSVLSVCGVHVDTNDDAARIDPRCIREDGSGWVERREHAIAQQKSVCDVRGIGVCPYDVALGVIPPGKRKDSTRKINRGEGPFFVAQVSVSHSTTIRVSADDLTGRVNRAGSAANCSGWIEACEGAFLGHYKAVVSARVARSAAGRVGTVKSGHLTRGVETRESGARCTWEVQRCVFPPIQNETVADTT